MNRGHFLAIPILVAALVGAGAFGGTTGAYGMGLGLGASGAAVAVLALIVKVAGRLAATGSAPPVGTLLIGFAFLLKVPFFLLLGSFAQGLGGAAVPCFVAGVILVYSSLVVWAAGRP